MRNRHQKGSLSKRRGWWQGQWWEDGHRRKRNLGRVGKMSKTGAQTELAKILAPINAKHAGQSHPWALNDFVDAIYFPFYRRKWKRSTFESNEDRMRRHILADFGGRSLISFTRDELQTWLDAKAAAGFSYSTVAHLRWDLRQLFGMAVAEGYLCRNPAELLFIPRICPRPDTPVMTIEQVRTLFSVLDLRERAIAGFALVAGMRPGEIFGLKWGRLDREFADIKQRLYRGEIDTPKTVHSVRHAALSDGLARLVALWREFTPNTLPDAWVFPSENLATPLAKDNCWRRHFKPKLAAVGLEWVDFHVMRRTHNCLMKELDVDPKVRCEQMGHTLDVNENTYTKTSLARRREAVNRLEAAIRI